MERESIVFYKSFFDSIDSLPEDQQAGAYKAIIEYGLYGKEPEPGNMGYTLWLAFRKQIDVNQKRFENSKNKKKANSNQKKTKHLPKYDQNDTKRRTNVNVNVNENVNVNANDNENVNVSAPNGADTTAKPTAGDDSLSAVRGKSGSNPTPYQEIVDLYNSVCVSLPKVRSVSEARRKLIRSRYKQHGLDGIKLVFEKAEASDFLTGRKANSQWSCGFDWLLNESNFLKVTEGNYDNRGGVNNGTSGIHYSEDEINEIFAADII